MAFPKDIRIEALKLSARHCCVCHRYKGIKMEVHHLIQEADGGPNTLENAIPVCFDCHSDAGHFNDRHPKGSKFSIKELRQSRDKWYEIVQAQSIPEKLDISKHIQTNYYVLHTFEILENVLGNDFSSLNKFRERVLFSANNESKFWNDLLIGHKKDFKWNIEQQLMIEVKQFDSLEEYTKKYNDVEIIKKDDMVNSYYQAVRKVTWDEVLKMDIPKNYLSVLAKTKIDINKLITSILIYVEDTCSGETPIGFTEYLKIEPLSFIFLGITNASKEQIKLNSLNCGEESFQLPNFNILSKEMVLIPLSTATNLHDIDRDGIRLSHLSGDRATDLSRVLNLVDYVPDDIFYLNKKMEPNHIIYNDNEGEYKIDVHKLDFNNLYSINSYWQCGSCPHLFFIDSNNRQFYVRELLKSSSNTIGIDRFQIPPNIIKFIIRELEDEVTFLNKIEINQRSIGKDIKLEKGESLIYDVQPNDVISVTGGYVPYTSRPVSKNDYWIRNYLVSQSNKQYNYKQKKASLQHRV